MITHINSKFTFIIPVAMFAFTLNIRTFLILHVKCICHTRDGVLALLGMAMYGAAVAMDILAAMNDYKTGHFFLNYISLLTYYLIT